MADGFASGSCTHALTRPQASLPVASDLFFQSQRLVSQIVLLFSQTADESRQLSILPEQPLRQGAGGASCQQGNTLRTAKRCSTQRLATTFTGFPINQPMVQFKATRATDLGDRGQTGVLLQHGDDLIYAGLHPGDVFTLHLGSRTATSN